VSALGTTDTVTTRSSLATPSDAIPLLQELIRSACVNDGSDGSGQEIRNVNVLRSYFEGLPVEIEIVEPLPGRANIIATLRGKNPGAASLAFVGHLDVVPADPGGWSRDPFGGELVDGEIWGRGAVDMLNFTAAMAVAFRIVAESVAAGTEQLDGDLVFVGSADEEAGSRYGMGWLVTKRPDLVLTDYAITESGGGIPLGPPEDRQVTVTSGQKGAASRKIRVRGESGHGSMPYAITSGALLAAQVVERLASHRTAVTLPNDNTWPNLLRALGITGSLLERLLDPQTVDDALPETGQFARILHALSHLTMSPNVVSAGTKANVIPGEGVVDVDIRLLPGQTGDDADRELALALDSMPGTVTIESVHDVLAVATDCTDALFTTIAEVIGEFYPGARALPVLTPGGNDARHYLTRDRPCYGFGLFSEAMDFAEFRRRFHGDDERIDAKSVEMCAAGYVRIAQRLSAHTG
jgi:acetylornithine deacetylase/succinyl-diaminopimelate desuccinylase-like protein